MIKNIIFDLGNIIVPNPSIDTVKKFFKNEDDATVFNSFIFKSDLWKMMDLGQISNIEIAEKIANEELVKVSDYGEVREFMAHWFEVRKVNQKTIDLAKRLKENGFKLYILSNMATSTFEYLSSKYDFFSIVDGSVVLAYEGVKKPDKKIFDILFDRYSINPDESVLIDDDDTNKTFETANALGIKGRRVKPNDVEDIKALLKENSVNFRVDSK